MKKSFGKKKEMNNVSDTYDKSNCCGTDCHWLNKDSTKSCWGKVNVVDEVYTDDDYWWIHACEGHQYINDGGKYVSEVK
jgi:hypothetical protein